MPHFISSGNDYKIKNVNLTDAYQDITLPRSCNSFAIQVRDNSKILWCRDSDTESSEWTFKEGQPYSIDGSMGVKVGETITIGRAKCAAESAADVLEIWYWYQ